MGQRGLRRNFVSILLASAMFGLGVGIYDLLFPYYLDDIGVSFANMGFVFSLSALVIAFASVYLASATDAGGRKGLYSLGIGLGSLSAFIAPVFTSIPVLIVSRTCREAAMRFRASIHGVLIFEFAREKFADLWAKSRGLEYLSEGSGQLIAGVMFVTAGFFVSFSLAALLLLGSLVVFVIGFGEGRRQGEPGSRPGLRDSYSMDISRPLLLLAAADFIFAVGLSTSHTFILPLFFAKKFGASVGQVALILGIHRMSFIPLLFTGRIIRYSLKKIYIASMIFEGIVISTSALVPGLLASAAIWLTHDVLGASLWLPAQASLIQHYARDEHRGRDVSKVRAVGALGWIVGPLIAGWAATASISLPFLLSGIVVAASVLPIIFIEDPKEIGAVRVGGPSMR